MCVVVVAVVLGLFLIIHTVSGVRTLDFASHSLPSHSASTYVINMLQGGCRGASCGVFAVAVVGVVVVVVVVGTSLRLVNLNTHGITCPDDEALFTRKTKRPRPVWAGARTTYIQGVELLQETNIAGRGDLINLGKASSTCPNKGHAPKASLAGGWASL